MVDIAMLTDLDARANIMFDASADPTAFANDLNQSVEDWCNAHDTDTLPEELCGAVSAVAAAAAIAFLYSANSLPLEEREPMVEISAFMQGADFAAHAVFHGDPMALEVGYDDDDANVGSIYLALSEWVGDRVFADSDADAFLASLDVLATADVTDGPDAA